MWDENVDGDTHTGEVYIGYPRRKIDTSFGRRTMEAVGGADCLRTGTDHR